MVTKVAITTQHVPSQDGFRTEQKGKRLAKGERYKDGMKLKRR